jgi:hypothetical protein
METACIDLACSSNPIRQIRRRHDALADRFTAQEAQCRTGHIAIVDDAVMTESGGLDRLPAQARGTLMPWRDSALSSSDVRDYTTRRA